MPFKRIFLNPSLSKCSFFEERQTEIQTSCAGFTNLAISILNSSALPETDKQRCRKQGSGGVGVGIPPLCVEIGFHVDIS